MSVNWIIILLLVQSVEHCCFVIYQRYKKSPKSDQFCSNFNFPNKLRSCKQQKSFRHQKFDLFFAKALMMTSQVTLYLSFFSLTLPHFPSFFSSLSLSHFLSFLSLPLSSLLSLSSGLTSNSIRTRKTVKKREEIEEKNTNNGLSLLFFVRSIFWPFLREK